VKRLKRQAQGQQSHHRVEGIVRMLAQAVKTTLHFVKEVAISKARQRTKELMKSYQHQVALKNRFPKTLWEVIDLTLEQGKEIWDLIDQFVNPKTRAESITQIS